MTHRVVFSPEARAQLVDLYRYIAREAVPATAQTFTDAIVAYCEALRTFPLRGTRRDEVVSGLRTIGFCRRVTIAFTVDDDAVTILGVFYAGQDYERALQHGTAQAGEPQPEGEEPS